MYRIVRATCAGTAIAPEYLPDAGQCCILARALLKHAFHPLSPTLSKVTTPCNTENSVACGVAPVHQVPIALRSSLQDHEEYRANIVSLVDCSELVDHLSAMSQEFSLGERRFTASGDPIDGFSCERKMSSACSITCSTPRQLREMDHSTI